MAVMSVSKHPVPDTLSSLVTWPCGPLMNLPRKRQGNDGLALRSLHHPFIPGEYFHTMISKCLRWGWGTGKTGSHVRRSETWATHLSSEAEVKREEQPRIPDPGRGGRQNEVARETGRAEAGSRSQRPRRCKMGLLEQLSIDCNKK